MTPKVDLVRVFPEGTGAGGNPAPIVLDAAALSSDDMRAIAARSGHESGFVLQAGAESDADCAMRYFVPEHEMEMCGHATVGALWLMRRAGRWQSERIRIDTLSGRVEGFARGGDEASIEITQPLGRTVAITDRAAIESILGALRLPAAELLPLPILNAATSRVKTLIGVRSVAALDALAPDFTQMKSLCERIGSTGLYPFAVQSHDERIFRARQFPKSSGYPEDAATGIAAAALLFGLREYGLIGASAEVVRIKQGQAMGRPSEIRVRLRLDDRGEPIGCFVGGRVVPA